MISILFLSKWKLRKDTLLVNGKARIRTHLELIIQTPYFSFLLESLLPPNLEMLTRMETSFLF